MSCIALVFQGDIHQGWGLLYICPITDSHKFLIVLWSMALNGGQRWRPSGRHGKIDHKASKFGPDFQGTLSFPPTIEALDEDCVRELQRS